MYRKEIIYLGLYKDGSRIGNAGFMKVENREGESRLHLKLQNIPYNIRGRFPVRIHHGSDWKEINGISVQEGGGNWEESMKGQTPGIQVQVMLPGGYLLEGKSKNAPEHVSRGIMKETKEETKKEIRKEAKEEITKETIEEAIRETTKEEIEEAIRKTTKKTIGETTEERKKQKEEETAAKPVQDDRTVGIVPEKTPPARFMEDRRGREYDRNRRDERDNTEKELAETYDNTAKVIRLECPKERQSVLRTEELQKTEGLQRSEELQRPDRLQQLEGARRPEEPQKPGTFPELFSGPSSEQAQQEGYSLKEDKWEQILASYERIHPYGDERVYVKLEPKDFIILQAKYQHLVNNSFLLHGFYNYRYVILGKEQNYYLGVPGVFYEREKMVALMFGFEAFECPGGIARAGEFGYYLRKVEL